MIKVLGASGSLDKDKACISFQINETTIIDAGNVMRALGEKSNLIENVFLTHAHFDHLVDLPFLIETHFAKRTNPLKVYALKQTIATLESHIFNDIVWPRFQNIEHPTLKLPLLSFEELAIGEQITCGDSIIKVVDANHTDGACGFIVKQNGIGCLITGDTYLNPAIAQTINQDSTIQSLIIDTSFPSYLEELALASKHLTTTLLQKVLDEIQRPIDVFPYHVKPAYEKDVTTELKQLRFKGNIQNILESGDSFELVDNRTQITHNSMQHSNANAKQLQSLLTTAQALSSETNLDRLLEMILQHAMDFANADAGTLYRLADNKEELVFTVVQNRSLDIHMGGSAQPISWDNLPLYLENGQPNEQMVANYCALNKQVINIDNVYENQNFNFEGTKKFDRSTGYQSHSMLVIPLLNTHQELLGVLQLINKTDSSGKSIAFEADDEQNSAALASQAAISLTNALLIKELETLFESVIGTMTKAFDEKCSFTSGHVRLVAELSQIIAQGISEDQTVYKEVNYTAEELHAINIAALLHDVGKIATPEFIMQKSTKLEKVYDRINAIQDRIEIVKRDLLIQHLKAELGQPVADRVQNSPEYLTKIDELDELFQFIKTTNQGSPYLQDEDLKRIAELSQYRYQVAGETMAVINEDEKINLSIRAGTLNNQERDKIMDHARVSLEILKTLPFPKKYERVVNIAANHHEKLDGSGYPRGLTAKDIRLEDRILILADLYEALSSKDRPYKEPNTLSQIAKILCSMANAGQIDKTLLKFFYESGTYKNFNTYLSPTQLDDIILELN
ncbi:hypothetical protein THMIRHAM_00920 [Thiomicrorhabdus immobilis]|uniref:HD-GYP domain-containing protein n=1 Tax=Thiomicrorhabdus immobilis TaxID=2791037 RepID=A0ABM7MAF7_9GAMM|nr:HD domain-containing phosphohydrolase [Thiomicrorhabdus immobilis]BCN92307.1 hypothetical protein THMIRHAM_00920 [Thiomicrorhabdus immobilis]